MDLGTANTIIIHNDKIVVDEPSIVAIEEKTGKPVLGVVPHIDEMGIDDEDSVSLEEKQSAPPQGQGQAAAGSDKDAEDFQLHGFFQPGGRTRCRALLRAGSLRSGRA